MRNFLVLCILGVVGLTFNGCKDYLTEKEPGASLLSDFFTSTDAATQVVTGCYVPLMWEYNNTYISEWFIGDIVSDDALKGGGGTTDMAGIYDMENWKTESTNEYLLQYYRAQYIGVGRCNVAIDNISKMKVGIDKNFTQSMKERLLGEAYFLRAFYYFRLVRVFGGVPLSTTVVDDSKNWACPRATAYQVFQQIIADLEQANKYLWEVDQIAAEQKGRATKGAAQAMLLKVNLYLASPYWNKMADPTINFAAKAQAWGDSIINSKAYSLCPIYWDNFSLAGENGEESVFEIQYKEVPWGDYNDGFGYTAGSFTQILIRSRSSLIGGGWGFNHPTQNLYDEFEPEDSLRRDAAILVPADSLMQNLSEEFYLGNKLLNNKYGMYWEDAETTGGGFGQWGVHAARGPLNNKQIRYADVLLMYAEACLLNSNEGKAKEYINKVRNRVGLGNVGTYSITINGATISSPTVEQCLRHERRMELAMEGHRWFDLVRWGNTKAHIEAYQQTETKDAQSHLAAFIEGKHELFPIPSEEIILNDGMDAADQNPGY